MRLDDDVKAVLAAAETDGGALRLTGQLDRKLYAKVGKAIELAGGRWNRKAGAHLFGSDAAAIVAGLLGADVVKSEQSQQQFFPTPPEVVARLAGLASLEPWHVVLEPSAGRGAIASAVAPLVAAVDCIELHEQHAAVIRDAGYARRVTVCDFLEVPQKGAYDRVLMNPPFAKGADIAHVTHALGFVKPGGRLVSVMGLGATFRTDRATADFREVVEDAGGRFERLPGKSFAVSGTEAGTVIAVIPKATEAASGLEQLDLFGDAAA